MANEKKKSGSNSTKGTSRPKEPFDKSGRPSSSSSKQRSFQWDFVDNDDHQEKREERVQGVTMPHPPASRKKQAPLEKKTVVSSQGKKSATSSPKDGHSDRSRSVSRSRNLQASDVRTKDDLKRVAAMDADLHRKTSGTASPAKAALDDFDDDDSLILPSYGRTPISKVSASKPSASSGISHNVVSPTEGTLLKTEKTISSPESRERIRKTASSAKPTAKSPDTKTAKNGHPKSRSVATPSPKSQARPVDRPGTPKAAASESSIPAAPLPPALSRIPSRVKKSRMVWDPVKREYIPFSPPDESLEPSAATPASAAALRQTNESSKKRPPQERIRSKEISFREKNQPPATKKEKHDPSLGHQVKSEERHALRENKTRPDTGSKRQLRSQEQVSVRTPKARVPAPLTAEKPLSRSSEKKKTDTSITKEQSVEKSLKHQEDSDFQEKRKPSLQSKAVKKKKHAELPLRSGRGATARPPQERLADPADVEADASGFTKLGLSAVMLESLKVARYLEPTPIQQGVIPSLLQGKDVMGQARTGTGKTAAFSIPLIEMIEQTEPGEDPVALILVPTRELAVQVRDEAEKLSYGRDVRTTACYGGKPLAKQILRLREGADIVVGTPGRLLDLMNRGALSLRSLRWVVLDEADRMLDIGFRPDIEKILKRTPPDRQTLLFSATLPAPVVRLAERYMREPVILDFSNTGVAVETIEQYYITVDQNRKFDALVHLLKEQKPNQAIVFCRTKRGADRVGRMLGDHFDGLATIHGDLAQSLRDRVMSDFRGGRVKILVATDVVGRGIDVSGISHIINYDIPQFCDDYVHRVGRTGRMGREGVAFTLVTAAEGTELTRIEMRIDRLLKRAELPGFETFSKPVDTSAPVVDPAEAKPVYGKPIRKIRRAL